MTPSTHTIDLGVLTRGEVHNLVGHERGVEARAHFHLDDVDAAGAAVTVKVPDGLYTITPSFFQGMFAESVKRAGSKEAFLRRYSFEAAAPVLPQIDRGISASLMRRGSLYAH